MKMNDEDRIAGQNVIMDRVAPGIHSCNSRETNFKRGTLLILSCFPYQEVDKIEISNVQKLENITEDEF